MFHVALRYLHRQPPPVAAAAGCLGDPALGGRFRPGAADPDGAASGRRGADPRQAQDHPGV